MERTYTVALLLSVFQIYGVHGDPIFAPQYELRSVNNYPIMAQFPAVGNFVPQQPQQTLLHTNSQSPGRTVSEKEDDYQNFTGSELAKTFNEDFQANEDEQNRAAGRDESTYSYAHPPSYGYPTESNYGSVVPSGYHKPAFAGPANPTSAKIPLLKPDLLNLVKPVTTKVATKMNGLAGLVLSLLTGSVPGGLELRGFKDLLINGILRPLFAVKGGIKSLISKLAIPVISLILINIEVLITVWWLWEECPEKASQNSDKPSPEYNSYTRR